MLIQASCSNGPGVSAGTASSLDAGGAAIRNGGSIGAGPGTTTGAGVSFRHRRLQGRALKAAAQVLERLDRVAQAARQQSLGPPASLPLAAVARATIETSAGGANPGTTNSGGASAGETSEGGAGTQGSAGMRSGTAACSGKPGMKRGKSSQTVSAGGVTRTFVYYAPQNLDPNKPAPVVIIPHGFTMSGDAMFTITGYDKIADRGGAHRDLSGWRAGITRPLERRDRHLRCGSVRGRYGRRPSLRRRDDRVHRSRSVRRSRTTSS